MIFPSTPILRQKLDAYLAADPDFRATYDYTHRRLKESKHLTAHNWEHAYRDVINAIVIGEAEGADMKIVLPAMVMHDIGYLYGGKATTHGEVGAEKLSEYLKDGKIKIAPDKLAHIEACIRTHKGSVHDLVPETIEAKVVSDADILEKMGPVGAYQLVRSMAEFERAAEDVIRSMSTADAQVLATATGNTLASERRGFAADFAQALDEAYEPYREH